MEHDRGPRAGMIQQRAEDKRMRSTPSPLRNMQKRRKYEMMNCNDETEESQLYRQDYWAAHNTPMEPRQTQTYNSRIRSGFDGHRPQRANNSSDVRGMPLQTNRRMPKGWIMRPLRGRPVNRQHGTNKRYGHWRSDSGGRHENRSDGGGWNRNRSDRNRSDSGGRHENWSDGDRRHRNRSDSGGRLRNRSDSGRQHRTHSDSGGRHKNDNHPSKRESDLSHRRSDRSERAPKVLGSETNRKNKKCVMNDRVKNANIFYLNNKPKQEGSQWTTVRQGGRKKRPWMSDRLQDSEDEGDTEDDNDSDDKHDCSTSRNLDSVSYNNAAERVPKETAQNDSSDDSDSSSDSENEDTCVSTMTLGETKLSTAKNIKQGHSKSNSPTATVSPVKHNASTDTCEEENKAKIKKKKKNEEVNWGADISPVNDAKADTCEPKRKMMKRSDTSAPNGPVAAVSTAKGAGEAKKKEKIRRGVNVSPDKDFDANAGEPKKKKKRSDTSKPHCTVADVSTAKRDVDTDTCSSRSSEDSDDGGDVTARTKAKAKTIRRSDASKQNCPVAAVSPVKGSGEAKKRRMTRRGLNVSPDKDVDANAGEPKQRNKRSATSKPHCTVAAVPPAKRDVDTDTCSSRSSVESDDSGDDTARIKAKAKTIKRRDTSKPNCPLAAVPPVKGASEPKKTKKICGGVNGSPVKDVDADAGEPKMKKKRKRSDTSKPHSPVAAVPPAKREVDTDTCSSCSAGDSDTSDDDTATAKAKRTTKTIKRSDTSKPNGPVLAVSPAKQDANTDTCSVCSSGDSEDSDTSKYSDTSSSCSTCSSSDCDDDTATIKQSDTSKPNSPVSAISPAKRDADTDKCEHAVTASEHVALDVIELTPEPHRTASPLTDPVSASQCPSTPEPVYEANNVPDLRCTSKPTTEDVSTVVELQSTHEDVSAALKPPFTVGPETEALYTGPRTESAAVSGILPSSTSETTTSTSQPTSHSRIRGLPEAELSSAVDNIQSVRFIESDLIDMLREIDHRAPFLETGAVYAGPESESAAVTGILPSSTSETTISTSQPTRHSCMKGLPGAELSTAVDHIQSAMYDDDILEDIISVINCANTFCDVSPNVDTPVTVPQCTAQGWSGEVWPDDSFAAEPALEISRIAPAPNDNPPMLTTVNTIELDLQSTSEQCISRTGTLSPQLSQQLVAHQQPHHQLQTQVPIPPQQPVFLQPQHPPPQPNQQHRQPHNIQPNDKTSVDTMLLPMAKQLILCSTCKTAFNRAFICNAYLMQLNRPIQCSCGCVICTLCYRKDVGCSVHAVKSLRCTVNSTASDLANCPALENVGDWDVELNVNDIFKTDGEVNRYVQQILNDEHPPDIDKLRSAFNHLIGIYDPMTFQYWSSEDLLDEIAYRYVCIPHVPGFWDHVLVGTRPPPKTEKMISPDEYLPRLFNVNIGTYKFHWCCFVLKKQIILAMWCTSVPKRGQPKCVTLVDNSLKNFTASIEFRRMVFYLSRWFTAQYVSPGVRELKVVLDCKPSEGPNLVHLIALLASKTGMERVTLTTQQRHRPNDMNYSFNNKSANNIFTCPVVDDVGNYINIVSEFKTYHTCEASGIGLTRICTSAESYNFL